jgi:hypothetical protein
LPVSRNFSNILIPFAVEFKNSIKIYRTKDVQNLLKVLKMAKDPGKKVNQFKNIKNFEGSYEVKKHSIT